MPLCISSIYSHCPGAIHKSDGISHGLVMPDRTKLQADEAGENGRGISGESWDQTTLDMECKACTCVEKQQQQLPEMPSLDCDHSRGVFKKNPGQLLFA